MLLSVRRRAHVMRVERGRYVADIIAIRTFSTENLSSQCALQVLVFISRLENVMVENVFTGTVGRARTVGRHVAGDMYDWRAPQQRTESAYHTEAADACRNRGSSALSRRHS